MTRPLLSSLVLLLLIAGCTTEIGPLVPRDVVTDRPGCPAGCDLLPGVTANGQPSGELGQPSGGITSHTADAPAPPTWREDASYCGDRSLDLVAAHGRDGSTGTVDVASNATELVVELAADEGYRIAAVQIFAGEGPMPVGEDESPAVALFPIQADLGDAPAAVTTIRVPLETIGAACDMTLEVAVHADLVVIEEGVPVGEESGWATEADVRPRGRPGAPFDYDVCCGE
jgi:hypothetical protein